jgi:hypothetical protein
MATVLRSKFGIGVIGVTMEHSVHGMDVSRLRIKIRRQ